MKIIKFKNEKYAIRRWNWFKFRFEYLDLNREFWWSICDRYTSFYYSSVYKEIVEKRLMNFKQK